MKRTKARALLTSVMALILCCAMLISSTFAWFTDSVTSNGNIIQSGNLDAGLLWKGNEAGEVWKDVEEPGNNRIYDYQNWEPGYTDVKYIKLQNNGSLAFRYVLNVIPNVVTEHALKLAEVIDVYCAVVTEGEAQSGLDSRATVENMTKMGTLKELLTGSDGADAGVLLPAEGKGRHIDVSAVAEPCYTGEVILCLGLKMQETAGNDYQNLSVGDGFTVQLLATQYTYEKDSFDEKYDVEADLPVSAVASAEFDGVNDVILTVDDVNTREAVADVTVPAGAVADPDAPVTVQITERQTVHSGVTVEADEVAVTYDITVDNINGSVPVTVVLYVGEGLEEVALFHNDVEITDAVYDSAAGTITFSSADFSPFTVRHRKPGRGPHGEKPVVPSEGYLLVRVGSYGKQIADNRYVAKFSVITADGTQGEIYGAINEKGYYQTKQEAQGADCYLGLYACKRMMGGYYTLYRVDNTDGSHVFPGYVDGVFSPTSIAPGDAGALDPAGEIVVDDSTMFIIAEYNVTGAIVGYKYIQGYRNISNIETFYGGEAEAVWRAGDNAAKLVFLLGAAEAEDKHPWAEEGTVVYLSGKYTGYSEEKYYMTAVFNGNASCITYDASVTAGVFSNGFYCVDTVDGTTVTGIRKKETFRVVGYDNGVLKINGGEEITLADIYAVYQIDDSTDSTSTVVLKLLTEDEVRGLKDVSACVAETDSDRCPTVVYVRK